MQKILLVVFLLAGITGFAQSGLYTVAQAHSHNDYEKEFPFWEAYNRGFGSIEVDIFLSDGELIVAHDLKQVALRKSLEAVYLQPLSQCIQHNNGNVYADTSRVLQLLVDIKTDATTTLQKLVEVVQHYPAIIANKGIKIVISGNRPDISLFTQYPSYIFFDGEFTKQYSTAALSRVALFSDNFASYSNWNGKGLIPAAEINKIKTAIQRAHGLQKKIRFWNAPDILNSWYAFMKLGVDYINTDHIKDITVFFQQLPDRSYSNTTVHQTYKPQYRNDGMDKPVKNIILFIGDGTGLAQLYAGYTANKAALNVFNMHYTGLSKTSSYDNYITDSAPGSTAFSSGQKTNNRAVGVDHTGKPLQLLPELFFEKGKKIKTAIITSGDITDATPADFYAHQSERSSSKAILYDLLASPVDIIMGKENDAMNDTMRQQLATKFTLVSNIDSVGNDGEKKWLLTEARAGLSMLEGRGDWVSKAFQKTLSLVKKNKAGFFLMLEGAQVDHGGHANKLPWLVTEVLDFDKVIGEAMQFADSNGETLIIVTADHETGGLSLTGGDYTSGYISGQFSTADHTAIPVPVFAYGPGSQRFTGVYENTAIYDKILQVLGMKK